MGQPRGVFHPHLHAKRSLQRSLHAKRENPREGGIQAIQEGVSMYHKSSNSSMHPRVHGFQGSNVFIFQEIQESKISRRFIQRRVQDDKRFKKGGVFHLFKEGRSIQDTPTLSMLFRVPISRVSSSRWQD